MTSFAASSTDVAVERNVACDAFPNPEVPARQANHARQRLRPQDPTTLDFGVDT